MTKLSPAAQAVLKAACIHHGLFNEEIIQRRRMLAAALRAAADQVVPEEPLIGGDQRWMLERCDRQGWMLERDARQACRKKLSAIATELENHQ